MVSITGFGVFLNDYPSKVSRVETARKFRDPSAVLNDFQAVRIIRILFQAPHRCSNSSNSSCGSNGSGV